MNSLFQTHTQLSMAIYCKIHTLEKVLTQEHATDRHCKQFILTAFWCKKGQITQNAVSS